MSAVLRDLTEDYTSTIRHFISVGTTEAYLVACSILGFIVVAHFALPLAQSSFKTCSENLGAGFSGVCLMNLGSYCLGSVYSL